MSNTRDVPAAHDDDTVEDLVEISYDQQRFAARPERLRPRARRRQADADKRPLPPPFEPDGRNPAYVAWLEQQSMLHDATVLGRQLAGHHSMWASPYAHPTRGRPSTGPRSGSRPTRCRW